MNYKKIGRSGMEWTRAGTVQRRGMEKKTTTKKKDFKTGKTETVRKHER